MYLIYAPRKLRPAITISHEPEHVIADDVVHCCLTTLLNMLLQLYLNLLKLNILKLT